MSVEVHRKLAMSAIEGLATWKKSWPVWRKELSRLSDGFSDEKKVHELGMHLRDVFFKTNEGDRGQSSVSSGGAGWECLVVWYLNLVLSGTNAVAVKQARSVVPQTILDATTVSYGVHQTNTESDVCVIVYPDDFEFPEAGRNFIFDLDKAVAANIHNIELGIIQCKTNWNDNAQIPMLWDMIYKANFGSGTNIQVGKNGYGICNFSKFSYSFVTVPSQKEGRMPSNPSNMAVRRVSNLTGGNYWGMPTKSGVALSLSEIFSKNFISVFRKNVRANIRDAIDGRMGLFEGLLVE